MDCQDNDKADAVRRMLEHLFGGVVDDLQEAYIVLSSRRESIDAREFMGTFGNIVKHVHNVDGPTFDSFLETVQEKSAESMDAFKRGEEHDAGLVLASAAANILWLLRKCDVNGQVATAFTPDVYQQPRR